MCDAQITMLVSTRTTTRAAAALLLAVVARASAATTTNVHQSRSLVEKPVNERYPHAVLIQSGCGGTIISPTWILTAAHCSLDWDYDGVVAGTDDVLSTDKVRGVTKRKILHPLFAVGPHWMPNEMKQIAAWYDFMLLELKEPLPLDGKRIAAAALDGAIGAAVPEHLHVAFAGYGALNHGESMSFTMHENKMQTISDRECAENFVQFNPTSMFCAKSVPPRCDYACHGDSGSGLVYKQQVIGIASWVENDSFECRPGTVTVFARVAAVRDWMRNVTGV